MSVAVPDPMASFPPILRSTPPPPRGVEVLRSPGLPEGEDAVCFAVEGAPPGACRLEELGLGAVELVTELEGRVLSVLPEELELEQDGWVTRLRYLIPGGVSLEPLAGRRVRAVLVMTFRRGAAPVVDLCLRDPDGALLLWARDGALASDRESQGVVVRVAQAPGDRPRLVLAGPRGLVRLPAGQQDQILVDGVPMTALALRVSPDDAAFVLLR